MRAARPARLPPAAPSEQLEAFYLRLALDQPITGGIPVGRPLNYGGGPPAGGGGRVRAPAACGSRPGGAFLAGAPRAPPPGGRTTVARDGRERTKAAARSRSSPAI